MAQAEQAIFDFDLDAAPDAAQLEKLDKNRDVREKWEVETGEWKVKDDKDHSSLPTSHSQLKEYAEVRPSGDRLGEPITLDEVLPHLKTFKLRQPYVYLVGGLVIHGKTEGDIDILIKDSQDLPDEFRHVLEWRIMRSLPEKLWDRVQFHYDNFHGPFTDNVPLYDLTIERVNEDNQVFRMDADPDDADLEKQEPHAASRELKGQAERSRAEDKIKLFRFFVPMKPVKGAFPEQRQSIEAFLDLFKEDDFPVHSTKKFDGANYEVHKSGERVVFYSEDGEENTDRFPRIVEAVRELPWRDLVLLAEIEMWRDGKHLPREAVTGYIHEKGEPPACRDGECGAGRDDSELVANVYDVVYAAGGPKDAGVDSDAGDIHKLTFAEREKYMEALGIEQATMDVPDTKKKLNRVQSLVSHNLGELRKHTEELAAKPGSEGNVAKKANGPYSLEGRSEAQIKFHNSAVLAGVVLERIETKTKGTYNYRYGVIPGKHKPHKDDTVVLHGKTYLETGKTFSTNTKAKPGDIIEIEVETLNLVRHPDGTVSVSGWAPRVMGLLEGRKQPDTVEQAVAAAKEGRVFQEKEITKEGETIYLDIQDADIDKAFEKANYVGNKRRLSKYIVGKFPEDGKTIFDPMCGCSAILIEAAKRGYRVKGNDLSIVPYWYSKGVFEGAPLSEADIEKLINATPHDGWLTTGWKGMYPRPRHIRRYLDGLAKKARQWQGAKGWAAKAVASRVLQTLYSDSISGYSTIRYESQDAVKRIIERSAKEVNGFIEEVSGKGKITNNDAKRMRYPRADVIYFDPPFFKRDKGYVHYFQSYKIMNSLLLGREWKETNLKPEDIPPILERLCKSCRHIFISTSSNEVVPYGKELSRHKRTMKRYRVAYTQTSGFGSRDEHQREHLYVAKATVGSGECEVRSENHNISHSSLPTSHSDPYMRLPSEDKTHRYVVQEHFRGKSMHADLRIESMGNENLIGWTLNTLIKGGIKEPVETVAQAKALKTEDYSKIDWETGEFKKRRKEGAEALVDVEIVSERKAVEPHAWLDIEGVVKPGSVGATKEYPGVFRIVDKGVCEYGSNKLWFHEYFPKSEKSKGGFRYRIFFRQLRAADIKGEEEKAFSPELLKEYIAHDPDIEREDWDAGYWEFLKDKGEVILPAAETKFRSEAAWLLIKPIDQTPYVISDGAVEKEWVPPKGFSALPKAVRSKVPHDFRYWQMERESERREMRDALVSAVRSGELKVGSEESLSTFDSQLSTFEKRRRVPFNQWGGSSKYSAALAKRLPEHKRYVEPFCGSAAVFFAKEPAEEELLADTDPEVVFALRYIQKLTPQVFEALKRFPWTVSRAGFERVKKCKPASDAERFWKHVYSRQCTWGGKPKASGFSTISDGKTYSLDDLWRFKERLKGARIVNQDWRKTLAECDGADTLFFIDPPYVDEWAHGDGIPPEEIAEAVSKLKGDFVVVYTDSARARRALSKAGRLFKMKIPETRYRGLWQKRNRLFVASAGIKKSDEMDWIELAEGSARFVLQYHYFRKRGEKPVRSGPTTWHYDLRIDAGEKSLRHWVLDHDITKAKETVGYFKRDDDKRALEAEGFYPPGSFMNPTKDTPSFVEIVDKGECRILVDQPALVKVAFEGKELKGVWLLEKKNSNWHVHRTQAAPRVEKEEAVACSP